MHKMNIIRKLGIYISYLVLLNVLNRIGDSIMIRFIDYNFDLTVFPTLRGGK